MPNRFSRWVRFFPMHGLFLVLVPLFPMRRLFLVLPAILLSPKRAMRQSVLRTDTQPLGTGRHLLAQMDA